MRFPPFLFAVLLIAGCGINTSDETVTAENSSVESAVEPGTRLVDGVQVVEIEAGPSGFSPESVHLTAGVPARLVFQRTTEAGCLEHVSVPEYGVEKTPLPLDEDVAVEFTPDGDGEYTFVCGMDMQRGTLIVSL